MTFAELRQYVWNILDDVDGGYFTASQVNGWLNNAQKEVQKILNQAFEGFTIKKVQTTLVVGQREYALPSDFKRLHRLELVLAGTDPSNENIQRVSKLTRNQQDLVYNQQGTSLGYYFRGNYVVLVPAPDQALTMRMEYEYLLSDMSNDSDTPDLPEQYHEFIALYAARKGFLKDGRDMGPVQKEIDEFETNMKRDAEQRNADEPRTVVQTITDNDTGYYGEWY